MYIWYCYVDSGLTSTAPDKLIGMELMHAFPSIACMQRVVFLNCCVMYLWSIDISILASVLSALEDFNDWMNLGLNLGIKQPTLNRIDKQERGDINDCKREMLSAWLRWKDNVQEVGLPSWKRLLDAMAACPGADKVAIATIVGSTPWNRWHWACVRSYSYTLSSSCAIMLAWMWIP